MDSTASEVSEVPPMDSKAVRTIVIFGMVAAFALTLLMMFSLNQVADTQTPQIAVDISKDLTRGLAAEPPANVRLTMSRDGKGVQAPRIYKLTIRPNAAVGADARAVSRLMYRASELCAAQLGDVKSGGARGLALIRAVAAAPRPEPQQPAVPETSQR
jgi:hypothetical protein